MPINAVGHTRVVRGEICMAICQLRLHQHSTDGDTIDVPGLSTATRVHGSSERVTAG
jgi:hypothetical protein